MEAEAGANGACGVRAWPATVFKFRVLSKFCVRGHVVRREEVLLSAYECRILKKKDKATWKKS